MGEPTYTQPNTVSDQECLQIITGVVSSLGPITEADATPFVQKAIDMLHEARTNELLIRMVMAGQIEIAGTNEDGDLLFRKPLQT